MTQRAPDGGPWTIVARLVRPQGRYGEILADILTDFPERFAERKRVYLVHSGTGDSSVREIGLENHWLHKGRVVLKFAGIESINDADVLRGLMVAIPESERVTPADGSYFINDLLGCEIVDVGAGPESIGLVTDFDREAGVFTVQRPTGDEALIPFAKAYLVNMDFAGKRIEMRLPAGLLDINAPVTDEERREMHESGSEE